MSKILRYKDDQIENFPHRLDLLNEEDFQDPSEINDILFHGFDISHIPKYKIYDKKLRGYSIIITGVLESGERANLIITNIPIYIDIKLSLKNNSFEKDEITKLIKGVNSDVNWEEVWKYPGVGFQRKKHPYIRAYFKSIWDRDHALKDIRNAKFETASDYDRPNDLLNSIIVREEWSIGDWSLLSNFDCIYDEEHKIHILFIDDVKDFKPVNRPLTSDDPICKCPNHVKYFHIPYDIEVNSETQAMPTVNNRNEKVFMLSGGVYISTQEKPLISFTISHMKCMEEKYFDYMSSDRRIEFMADDKPDWWLILTDNEEDTLMAYAYILGQIQPEFRSGFNSYSFDDPYVCTRIKQYGKYKEFIDKLSIIPYHMTNFGKPNEISEETLYKWTLSETRIKLEAGVFDNTSNRRRLHYLGSINVDIMVSLKKLNSKDDMVLSHALRSYLDRYGLPKKIDMPISDMNKYYYNEDGIGMLLSSDYCTVDALSCHRINYKIDLFQSFLTLSHLALCRPYDAVIRAGGHKVKNVIYCFGNRMDLNYSEFTKPEHLEGKYPGAIVFPPVRGRYTEVPTIALDYSSLYPSIIRALWISPETMIDVEKKPKLLKHAEEEGYDLFYYHPSWEVDKKDSKMTLGKKLCYVRKYPDGSNCRGVYPTALEFLTNIRKMYKKKLAKATDKVAELQKKLETDPDNEDLNKQLFEANLNERDYNQKQLAVKIISNTIYGQTGSKNFNLHDPYLASTITLMGQCLTKTASDIAEDMGYMRIYGDTDSVFLAPKLEMMNGATDPAEKVKICQHLAEDKLVPAIMEEIRRITKRETDVVKLELDKLLYPALYTGKKKYFGTIYEGDKKPHDYISGMEFVKRGRSQILVDLSKKVVSRVLDLNNDSKVIDMVLDVFKEGVDRIQKEPIEYFVKKSKFRVGKEGPITMFINRMKEKNRYDSILYELPEPNSTFEYIVTDPKYDYTHKGTMRKYKISDKMEFKHVVKQTNMYKPDYYYYLDDVVGAMARFICFHEEFNEDLDNVTDDEEIDKKSNENAKKFLREKLLNFMGIVKVGSTIVRRQSKYVNSEHTKQYGEFIHLLFMGYDMNIEINNLTDYIIDNTNNVPPIFIEGIDLEKIKTEREEIKDYIKSRNSKITGIYSRYINDITEASTKEYSKEELEEKFKKKTKVSSSTKNICEMIDNLKKCNSLLKNQIVPEDCCSDNACGNTKGKDPIITVLFGMFGFDED